MRIFGTQTGNEGEECQLCNEIIDGKKCFHGRKDKCCRDMQGNIEVMTNAGRIKTDKSANLTGSVLIDRSPGCRGSGAETNQQ